jgi:hypothetical protein
MLPVVEILGSDRQVLMMSGSIEIVELGLKLREHYPDVVCDNNTYHTPSPERGPRWCGWAVEPGHRSGVIPSGLAAIENAGAT